MTFPAILTKRGSALLAFLLVFACIASADTIYNNLNSTTDGGGGVGFLGDSFSTGSSAFTVEQVTLKLAASHADRFAVTVSLDGETIATLNDSSLPTSFEDVPINLSTPITLAANTRYWVNVFAGISSAGWAFSYDQTAQGVAGEYYSIGVAETEIPNIYGPFQMRVSGAGDPDPAPEAGSLPILLFDLGGLGLIWRGRKRIFASLPNLF